MLDIKLWKFSVDFCEENGRLPNVEDILHALDVSVTEAKEFIRDHGNMLTELKAGAENLHEGLWGGI